MNYIIGLAKIAFVYIAISLHLVSAPVVPIIDAPVIQTVATSTVQLHQTIQKAPQVIVQTPIPVIQTQFTLPNDASSTVLNQADIDAQNTFNESMSDEAQRLLRAQQAQAAASSSQAKMDAYNAQLKADKIAALKAQIADVQQQLFDLNNTIITTNDAFEKIGTAVTASQQHVQNIFLQTSNTQKVTLETQLQLYQQQLGNI